jgi:hypothetical protein
MPQPLLRPAQLPLPVPSAVGTAQGCGQAPRSPALPRDRYPQPIMSEQDRSVKMEAEKEADWLSCGVPESKECWHSSVLFSILISLCSLLNSRVSTPPVTAEI